MKPTCIYIFKLLIFFQILFTGISFEAFSQDEDLPEEEELIEEEELPVGEEVVAEDSASIDNQAAETSISTDSANIDYFENPFGIQIGIDLLKLGSFALDTETKYEAQVGISYKNVHFVAEAGYANYSSDLAYKNSDDYEVEGEYFRVGIDYAIYKDAKNQFLFGIRYGKSRFGDQGSFEVSSDLWNNFSYEIDTESRKNSSATWAEAVVGTQTLLLKNVYFGWYFRLRKLIDRTSYEPVDIYYIPGYGKSFSSSVPALNLFIKYKFSF